MSNPYESPNQLTQDRSTRVIVQAPAIALIVVSLIAIVSGSLALVMDLFLVVTGGVAKREEVNEGPISEYTQITIRSIWGVALALASSFVLYKARYK